MIRFTSFWDLLVKLACIMVAIAAFVLGASIGDVICIVYKWVASGTPLPHDEGGVLETVLLLGFGLAALVGLGFVLRGVPDTLSSYLYITRSLGTPCTRADAERLAFLFTTTDERMWYPCTAVTAYPRPQRLEALYSFANMILTGAGLPPEQKAQLLFKKAIAAEVGQQYHNAVFWYRQAIEVCPASPAASEARVGLAALTKKMVP